MKRAMKVLAELTDDTFGRMACALAFCGLGAGFGLAAGAISGLLRPEWSNYSGEAYLLVLIICGTVLCVGLCAVFVMLGVFIAVGKIPFREAEDDTTRD